MALRILMPEGGNSDGSIHGMKKNVTINEMPYYLLPQAGHLTLPNKTVGILPGTPE